MISTVSPKNIQTYPANEQRPYATIAFQHGLTLHKVSDLRMMLTLKIPLPDVTVMSIQAAPADFELVREGDLWVATHVETGIASQGDSPDEAVAMVEEAVALHQQEHHAGDEEYQRSMLEQFDIDIDDTSEPVETPDGMP